MKKKEMRQIIKRKKNKKIKKKIQKGIKRKKGIIKKKVKVEELKVR